MFATFLIENWDFLLIFIASSLSVGYTEIIFTFKNYLTHWRCFFSPWAWIFVGGYAVVSCLSAASLYELEVYESFTLTTGLLLGLSGPALSRILSKTHSTLSSFGDKETTPDRSEKIKWAWRSFCFANLELAFLSAGASNQPYPQSTTDTLDGESKGVSMQKLSLSFQPLPSGEYQRYLRLPGAEQDAVDTISAAPAAWHPILSHDVSTQSPAELQQFGQQLYHWAYPEAARRWLRDNFSECALLIDEQHADDFLRCLPWELLHDSEDYFATNNTRPLLRANSSLITDTAADQDCIAPLQMLFVSAQPSVDRKADGSERQVSPISLESELIERGLDLAAAVRSGQLEVRELNNASPQQLAAALRARQYDLLYISAHGSWQPKRGGALVLEDGNGARADMSARQFANALQGCQQEKYNLPRLVFLNCCLSGAGASGASFDLARAAAQAGAPAVVAMHGSVLVSGSRSLMRRFWGECFTSQRWQPALALARARAALLQDSSSSIPERQTALESLLLANSVVNSAIRPCTADEQAKIEVINAPPLRADATPRLSLLQHLDQAYQRGERNLGLYGLGGMGKTITAQQWALRCLRSPLAVLKVARAFWLDLRADSAPIAAQVALWLRVCGLEEPAESLRHSHFEGAELADELQRHLPDCEYLLIADNCEDQADDAGLWHNKPAQALLTRLAAQPRWRLLFTARSQLRLEDRGRAALTIAWQQAQQPTPTERACLIQSLWGADQLQKLERPELDRRYQLSRYPLCLYLYYRALERGTVEPLRVATDKIETYANLDYYLSKPTPAARSLLLLLAYLGEPLQLMELQLIVFGCQRGDKDSTSPWHQLDPEQLPEHLRELQALGLVESEAETYSLLPALQERALAATPADSHATNRALLALALYNAAKFFEQQLTQSATPALSRSMQRLSSLALRSALNQTNAELLNHCLDFYRQRAMWARVGEAQQLGTAVEFWLQDAAEQPMLTPLRGALASLWLELRLYPRALQTYRAILDDRSAHSYHGIVYHDIGRVYQEQQQWQQALAAYQRALELKEQHSQQHELGSTYHQIGIVYQEQQQWQQALDAYQRALELKEQHEQQHQLGSTHHQIGTVYEEQQKWSEALDAYQRALELKNQHGQQHKMESTFHQIGRVYQEQQQWQQALNAYKSALALQDQHGQQHRLGLTYHSISMVHQLQRQWQQALAAYQHALELYEQHDQQHQSGGTHHQIGTVYQGQQQWQQALVAYQRALEFYEQHGQQHEMGGVYNNIGMVCQEQRQWREALDAYQRALEFYEQHGQQHQMGTTYHNIGRVYQEQRQWQPALVTYQRALELYEQHGQQHESGDTYHQIGMAYQQQQQWQPALEAYQRALELKEQHGQQHEMGGTYHQIGRVYEQQSELSSACIYYHRALAAERALDPPNPETLRIIQASIQRANCDQQNPQ